MAVFYGGEGNDVLFGTSSDDSIYGFGGDDALIGDAGNDFLQGGAGADWLDGGAGIDTVDYNGNAAVTVDLGSGRGYGGEAEGDSLLNIENVLGTTGHGDTLIGNGAANGLSGYGGNDTLRGQDGDDSLSGMEGDDFLQGGSGADTLNGGAGIDTADYNGAEGVYVDLEYGVGYGGEAEGDTLIGIENVLGTTGYRDVIHGSAAANGLSGYGGDDTLLGRGGDDILSGMDGDDDLRGGAGADRLLGGAGVDIVRYEGNDAVYVNLGAGWGAGGEAQGDTLSEIEGAAGGNGNDTLIGSATGNTLLGSFGDDFLQGGAGADRLDGGDGIDTADYNGTTGVYVDLSAGLGYGGEAEGDTLSGIENVWGTAGYRDKLIGSEADNVLSGFGGSDDLWGLGGNDTLLGGNDGDTMVGGAGNDALQGDGGDDFLAGGSEADSFRYLATSDSRGELIDTIADFNGAEGDRIDLSAIDANVQAGGDQAFAFIGSNPFVVGYAGQLRMEVIGSDTVVTADVDGDAVADLTIVCQNLAGLAGTDFVL